MRKFLIFTLLFAFCVTSSGVPANSAVKLGAACQSVGQKTTLNGSTITCVKSGSKLIWSKGAGVKPYDDAFAKSFLAEAKIKASKIIAEAKSTANQMSRPPNCSPNTYRVKNSFFNSNLALLNLGLCDAVISVTASFLCIDGKSIDLYGTNWIQSTGTISLKAGERLYLDEYKYQKYFAQLISDCRSRKGFTPKSVNWIYQPETKVTVLSSNYSGVFNQSAATKKAEKIMKTAKKQADAIIADAKNPKLIAIAWKAAEPSRIAEAAKKAQEKIAEATRKAQDAGIGKNCVIGISCVVGNTGPGGGIVFYDAGSQQSWGRYLEFAPAKWTGNPWDYSWDPEAYWCTWPEWETNLTQLITEPNLANTLGTEIGKGKGNTLLAAKHCKTGAAALAASYRGGGANDWFLPSRDELNELCKFAYGQATGNAKVMCVADIPFDNGQDSSKYVDWGANSKLRPGFARDYYWSSSEGEDLNEYAYKGGSAWAKTFDIEKDFIPFAKKWPHRVRPIRAF